MNPRAIITPGEFQEICDRAVLAVDIQGWKADALPIDLAAALITEVHKGVCQQLGEGYEDKIPTASNEERIADLVVGVPALEWSDIGRAYH